MKKRSNKAGRSGKRSVDSTFTQGHSPVLVVALAAIAMFSQLFLLGVSYTNADYQQTEIPVRDYLAPAQLISPAFDQDLTIIAQNLRWSVTTAAEAARQPVIAFLGIDDSNQIVQPGYSTLATQAGVTGFLTPRVLGAYTTSQ